LEAIAASEGEITPGIEREMAALIRNSREAVSDAVLARRELQLKAERANRQSAVFAEEAARIRAVADVWEAAADRLGSLLIPALDVLGKQATPAGTAYLAKRDSYEFSLAPGFNLFDLPSEVVRSKSELNKQALKDLAARNALPRGIRAVRSESTSLCLRAPGRKGEAADEAA
jgi:hypothetical protein